ncbi:MAG: acyl-CoA dehydrogenase family protein [Nocardioides sp.]
MDRSRKQGFTQAGRAAHAVRLEAARAFMETATRLDAGEGADGAMNTEGAIAKYVATEAGNAAADAAIQAHGGYGYTRPYVVEKIKRDVRITTIYEGTSEIMEMTIARDRWQQHLKTRGQHYLDRAAALQAVHAAHPDVGAGVAALACQALAAVLEACRVGRLTRNQHVLFRLGELVALVETADTFSRRAAAALDGERYEKSPKRFDGPTLATMARVFAREAAQRVALDGPRYVVGSAEQGAAPPALPADAIVAAQAGLLGDMDRLADVLYDRG